MCFWRQKNAGEQSLGRGCGGFSTKIHATCDSHGNPLRFILTPGQRSDFVPALDLLQGYIPQAVLADRGYDSDTIVEAIKSVGAIVVIPPKKKRRIQRKYDQHLYKERNLVERLFNKLKNFRRIATRYDKLDVTFLGFLYLVGTYLWLK